MVPTRRGFAVRAGDVRWQGGNPLRLDLVHTFLELGDATSRNLAFSHCTKGRLSYGEETITETNLLEIRRRQPNYIHLEAFTKHKESQNGADWEWHIIGSKRTLKMRVQAKRVQRDGVLKVAHQVGSSKKQQRKLLLDEARKNRMKPVYCAYCTNCQREKWKNTGLGKGFSSFHYGCLLAKAQDVKQETRRLADIEKKCIPWHFLFLPKNFWSLNVWWQGHAWPSEWSLHRWQMIERTYEFDGTADLSDAARGKWPTIDDLNRDTDRKFDKTGVHKTCDDDLARVTSDEAYRTRMRKADEEAFRERGVSLIMIVDVRHLADAGEERERMPR